MSATDPIVTDAPASSRLNPTTRITQRYRLQNLHSRLLRRHLGFIAGVTNQILCPAIKHALLSHLSSSFIFPLQSRCGTAKANSMKTQVYHRLNNLVTLCCQCSLHCQITATTRAMTLTPSTCTFRSSILRLSYHRPPSAIDAAQQLPHRAP